MIFTGLKTDLTDENFLSSKKKGFYWLKNPILPMTTFYLQRKKRFYRLKNPNFNNDNFLFSEKKKNEFYRLKD